MFIAWTIAYVLLFLYLIYQDWDLRRLYDTPAWNWEVWGFASAFIGLLIRIGLNWLFDIPVFWRYALTFLNMTGSLLCLIYSRHLLRKDLKALLKRE